MRARHVRPSTRRARECVTPGEEHSDHGDHERHDGDHERLGGQAGDEDTADQAAARDADVPRP
ncbi:hypothetical protein [Pseudonocardia sp. N23]|uniref:hypothetical protein n=1 Tax=Pseudonocardia sp. N23 TaxID=1987376 RepID=UPI0011459CEC|nr:hypothetical protein [Pseudonocardia sp. N23]